MAESPAQAHIGLDANHNVRIEPETGGDVVISGTAWSAILEKLGLVDALVARVEQHDALVQQHDTLVARVDEYDALVQRLEAPSDSGELRELPANPLWWPLWMGPRV